MKKRISRFLSVFTLLLFAVATNTAWSQTIIPALPKDLAGYEGCLYSEVNLRLQNPPAGFSKIAWAFGDGIKDTVTGGSNLVKHLYTVAGRYIVQAYPLNASNVLIGGVILSDTVFINNLPTANVVSTNGRKFCYPANVCFYDSSKIAVPLPGRPNVALAFRSFLFGDGAQVTSSSPGTDKNWCHLYIDHSYKTYTITTVVRDKFGCEDTTRNVDYIYTVGDLGVQFAVNAPIGCAKTPPVLYTDATFINQTNDPATNPYANIYLTYPDSVKRFRWEFGDGAIDTVNWSGTTHRYTTNGTFTPRLIVEDKNGCRDTFVVPNGVRNFFFKFDVGAIQTPVCANPGLVCWTQTPVPGATKTWSFYVDANPPYDPTVNDWPVDGKWKPLSPIPTIFQDKNVYNPCRTFPCGYAKASLEITGPGCNAVTFEWDTVLVMGPQATIEVPGDPSTAIADSERYQCHIVNPLHFKNLSCHFKARNVIRLWDFDDKYARTCTTDTKNNINVFGDDTLSLLDPVRFPPGPTRPCNCKFSKDSLPIHVYTDWDSLALWKIKGLTAGAPVTTNNVDTFKIKSRKDIYLTLGSPRRLQIGHDTVINLGNGPIVLKWDMSAVNLNTSADSLTLGFAAPKTITVTEFGGVRLNNTSPPYSTKNYSCFRVKLMLYDSVNKCGDTATLQLPLGPPKAGPIQSAVSASGHTKVVFPNVSYADPTILMQQGLQCFGSAPNGIIFDLSKTVPSCTRAWVSINYDSASGIAPNKWVKQPGHFEALNNQQPWAIPPPPKQWPNKIAHNYFLPPGIADTLGWVTVGLVVGNGYGNNMCYDTAYYHHMLRFVPFSPAWTITIKDPPLAEKIHYCVKDTLKGSINTNYQDSVLAIMWNWNDGWVNVDSIMRKGYKRSPSSAPLTSYLRMRYTIDPDGKIKSSQNVSFIPDTVVGVDTLFHVYTKAGRYFPNVTMVNTQGCQQFAVKEIVVGFFNEGTVNDTVVCIGDTVQFRDSVYYWIYPQPIIPPYELYYVVRDPLLGGYRGGLPQSPYQLETIKWMIYRRDTVSGNNVLVDSMAGSLPKYAFKNIGLYTIQMITTDSMHCVDYDTIKVTVGGVIPRIYTKQTIFSCTDTIRFFDSSMVLDPYYQALGVHSDSIMTEIENGYWWVFGDGKTRSILRDPYHDYTANGKFTIRHAVTNYSGCSDTVSAQIEIKGPTPLFDILGDSVGCAPFTARFVNKSTLAQSYTWIWGYKGFSDNTNSSGIDSFTYTDPGQYCVYLRASDVLIGQTNICPVRTYPDTTSPLEKKRCILVLPTPPVHIQVDTLVICAGDSVKLTANNTDAAYKRYLWNFGDNKTANDSPAVLPKYHTYDSVGTFSVVLTPKYTPPPGEVPCYTSDTLKVKVVDVEAVLSIDSPVVKPIFGFKNHSRNGVQYIWDFDFSKDPNHVYHTPDGCSGPAVQTQRYQYSTDTNITMVHCYGNDTGKFVVCLTAYSIIGCIDSVCVEVTNEFTQAIDFPNVFTPGGDGFNDHFITPILGAKKYEMVIFNRWGNKVFETKEVPYGPFKKDYAMPLADKNKFFWNGKLNNSGEDCPEGVYYWVCTYELRTGGEKQKTGSVTVIRK